MKNRFHLFDLLVLALLAVPFIYLAYQYPRLPAIVPTHFGLDGTPNGTSEKSRLWLIMMLTGGVSFGVYLLIRFLPQIDPKKRARYSTSAYNKIGVVVVLLQTIVSCFILYAAEKGSFGMGNILPVALGLFIAVMGNLMHNIKPNYFVGIRTPWTLQSEETWRKTHRLGGKVWFGGGLIVAAVSVILPARAANYFLFSAVLILALIPVVYSYFCFKSIQPKSNN